MRYKVGFLSKHLLRTFFYRDVAIVSTVVSFCLIFFEHFEQKTKLGIVAIAGLLLRYIYEWLQANRLKKAYVMLNNTTVEICEGDIFKQNGLKVIAFNEYFDTKVDNEIISSNTLNGKYIKEHVKNIKILDKNIKDKLRHRKIDTNRTRKIGKKDRYKLGTIFKYNDFLLVAFSHFDEFNKAYLSITDYVSCLIEMWNEIDKCYNGMNIVLPIIGSGITRLNEKSLSEQELLEILLWSFRLSGIKFTKSAKIKVVTQSDVMNKINLYQIQQEFS